MGMYDIVDPPVAGAIPAAPRSEFVDKIEFDALLVSLDGQDTTSYGGDPGSSPGRGIIIINTVIDFALNTLN